MMTEKRKGRPMGTTKSGLKYLSEDQLEAFFQAVRKPKGVRDDLAFSLCLYLGLRVSELVGIKLSQINFDGFQITINGLKSGRIRTYDINGRLWKKLLRWLKERKEIDVKGRNQYLFPSRLYHDEHIEVQTLKSSFKQYLKRAELSEDFSIHSLRHSCGILRAKSGESAIAIMKWLRHRAISSSQVYFEQIEFENDDERAKETFAQFL